MKTSKNQPLSLQISQRIEDDIIFGVFKPGVKLDEIGLSEKYQVSRTPVREALKLLAAEGIIDIIPRRGAFVPKIEPMQLYEMFEVMAELESMCGRLAARRISTQEKQHIMNLHETCLDFMQSQDADGYYEANKDFHFALYDASHNQFLAEQAKQLHKRLHPYRRLQLRVHNRMQHSYVEHQQIIDAIFMGDEEQSQRLLREHVVIQGQKFADFIAQIQ